MRIGINLFDIIPGQGRGGGGQTYVTQLVRHLARIDRENQYFLFVNAANAALFATSNSSFVLSPVNLDSGRKWTRAVWEQVLMPRRLRALRIDVLHSPLNTSPLFCPCRSVVTIHDMVNEFYRERFPEAQTWKMRYQRFVLKHTLRRCNRVIAVSNFTKSQIIRYLGVESERIVVIAEAQSVCRANRRDHLAEANGTPLLLTVTSDSLHKNTPALIQALAKVKQTWGTRLRLVIVGTIRDKSSKISIGRQALTKLAEQCDVAELIEIRGSVCPEELENLYRRATFLVLPSLYEGFGLPVLEAMAQGLPVLCSRAASLPEVAADCALYFDPVNPEDIAAKILQALTQPSLLAALAQKGLDRTASFSWERTAQETLAVYRQVCQK